jgi:hypothetical protein
VTSSKLEPQIHQHDFIAVPSIFSLLAFSYCFGSTEKENRERDERESRKREARERKRRREAEKGDNTVRWFVTERQRIRI